MDATRTADTSTLSSELEELQLSKNARWIKECNKTLNMTYMKANNPWKPNDFPDHYLPCPELGLFPPVFVLGVAFELDQWLDFAKRKDLLDKNDKRDDRVSMWTPIRVYLSEACGHSVELYTCYTTPDGTFAYAFVSNYTVREGDSLHEPMRKMRKIFAEFGREPKWYLDFGTNAENLQQEDWTMDVEII